MTNIQWEPQPEPWNFVQDMVRHLVERERTIETFAASLRDRTGTRLVDWVQAITLPKDIGESLACWNFELVDASGGVYTWSNKQGLFPKFTLAEKEPRGGLVIKVESISDFVVAHDFANLEEDDHDKFHRGARRVFKSDACDLWVSEWRGCSVPEGNAEVRSRVKACRETFHGRDRDGGSNVAGFQTATSLIDKAIEEIGRDLTCDAFFAAERDYWESRNHAARVQKARQDVLGLGWANHDHHTYRSSRESFASLIEVLELLGLECRERFYAGREAGWGAQVLEHPEVGIVVFADVDLSPDEVSTDFAHEPLPPRAELGTVGLWCRLHGESFLQAGMHHLECQFDFDAAREQLARAGIETMGPFTDFSYLKQAFTRGETWQVDEARLKSALSAGFITAEQAERFRREGAIGSHLEILERNDGYKGFNQTGVSDIIQRTDPRK